MDTPNHFSNEQIKALGLLFVRIMQIHHCAPLREWTSATSLLAGPQRKHAEEALAKIAAGRQARESKMKR